ncbi:MAG: hypothetical protein O3C31_04705 [Bacteroidetes bacterium]|nr:hypothetical protein [Bacteroidota bacterium]MDA0885799.1 hypothetical protein [Bacteroidota bacterium]
MGDTFIFIMGLVCTGAVVAATFLSINELKDVNEPQLQSVDMAEGARKHLKLISTAILIIIGFVSLGLFCFYFIFA